MKVSKKVSGFKSVVDSGRSAADFLLYFCRFFFIIIFYRSKLYFLLLVHSFYFENSEFQSNEGPTGRGILFWIKSGSVGKFGSVGKLYSHTLVPFQFYIVMATGNFFDIGPLSSCHGISKGSSSFPESDKTREYKTSQLNTAYIVWEEELWI